MSQLDLLVTLWPTFPHFKRFVNDDRLKAIRMNSAMINAKMLEDEFKLAESIGGSVPLYFDIKGKQLRVVESHPYDNHLELIINHPIEVKTPTVVLFKAGEDRALLREVVDGTKLIFDGGPEFMVYDGESLHIKHESLKVNGATFTDFEIEKINKAVNAGYKRFFLSYVESQRNIDEFREYVGDSEIVAKIENKKGLQFVSREFKKQDNLYLMAARGDLYVEVERPHDILSALKLIVDKDPEAHVGSRILLSVVHDSVPSCADFSDIAWLYDIGYRKMMLCDEICLKETLLATAIDAFDQFRSSYSHRKKSSISKDLLRKMIEL